MEQAQTNAERIYDQVITFAALYGGRILLAIITLMVGLWLIGWITRLLSSLMAKQHVDRDVQPFLLSMVNAVLRVLLLLSIANTLGVETTSFVAIIGAAGLAVGLALQGSLANFAGGVLILTFKPFRVGDLISAQGFTGTVEAIRIFDTILVTLDNKTIILPNGPLSTSSITNISTKGIIRVDQVYTVGSQNDLDATKASLLRVVNACPYALKDRSHDVLIAKLNANSRDYDVRVWTKSETYWETYYYMLENVARQFGRDGIEAPKPKMFITNEEPVIA
ncbi:MULTISPECIES: mechanosensitive ion channel family protein [Spirosoma]|uniref:Mechanosensitive ion channel n=1 Tax=Spirosoma liriopis TaxID=2937440 RepID=A0ABT0HEP5_9BACT|nr:MULTISPECIES: mechanosensitive ion channel domain-containing protein [Spirosoma]MCK8490327.1 mechanosensitive ion channel [Spirosoma liriopis]UHG89702.1 mechanosensitive ion channel [Spirosoma oryzicola]